MVKAAITELLLRNVTGRDTTRLVQFMEESDFFTAPASRKYHLNTVGGLAEHSLNVYRTAIGIVQSMKLVGLEESVIIASLCHDLCKVNYYFESKENATPDQMKYVRDLFFKGGRELPVEYQTNKSFCSDLIGWDKGGFVGEKPTPQPQWEINDEFPLGHGTKSVLVASKYVDLTEDELLAVKWHSGSYEVSEMEKRSFEAAKDKTPLVPLLHAADYLATFVIENKKGGVNV